MTGKRLVTIITGILVVGGLVSFTLIEKSETKSKLRIMDRVANINATPLENVVVVYSREVIEKE